VKLEPGTSGSPPYSAPPGTIRANGRRGTASHCPSMGHGDSRDRPSLILSPPLPECPLDTRLAMRVVIGETKSNIRGGSSANPAVPGGGGTAQPNTTMKTRFFNERAQRRVGTLQRGFLRAVSLKSGGGRHLASAGKLTKPRCLGGFVVGVAAAALPCHGADKTWNQSGGGSATTAAYWTPSGVPGAADNAILPNLGVNRPPRRHAGGVSILHLQPDQRR
jgi:hypothetical protein